MAALAVDYNLTPDQFRMIASVGLDWAFADMLVGVGLAMLCGVQHPSDAADLVHAVDLKKKIDLVHVRYKRGTIPEPAASVVPELVFVANNYRSDRNMIAHGILLAEFDADTPTMLWSQSKLKKLDLAHLEDVAQEARYAKLAAQRFMGLLGGIPGQKELPPRPASQPR